MHIIGVILWIFAAWRWGDWRNWEKYHSTMLYMIMFALLSDILTYTYSLWIFRDFFLPTHTLNSLVVTFIGFPCSVLVYLSCFPHHSIIIKKVLYVVFWVLLYLAIEYFYQVIGLFHYNHGWSIWWSVLFDIILFPMLLLHHKKPLLAYLFGIPIIIFYFLVFDVPINKMK